MKALLSLFALLALSPSVQATTVDFTGFNGHYFYLNNPPPDGGVRAYYEVDGLLFWAENFRIASWGSDSAVLHSFYLPVSFTLPDESSFEFYSVDVGSESFSSQDTLIGLGVSFADGSSRFFQFILPQTTSDELTTLFFGLSNVVKIGFSSNAPALYDNFVIRTQSEIPEPMTAALLGTGLVSLVLRRRRADGA